MNRPKVIRTAASRTLLAVLLVLTALSAHRVQEGAHLKGKAAGEGPIYLPRADVLRPLSLGYHNVLADLLWFRTISYFGQHYRGDRAYPWLEYMCGLVTDLDPRAEAVYRFAGMILPWEAHDPDAGIRIMEKGTRNLPNSWKLAYWLGFSYYFFKDDYKQAIRHLQRGVDLPGSHPNVARLLAVLAQHRYGPETTLAFLNQMRRDVKNDDIRHILEEQARKTRMAVDMQSLKAAVDRYRQRFGVPPVDPRMLVAGGVLGTLPRDPFGWSYRIDPATGEIYSSSGRTPPKLYESRVREQIRQELGQKERTQ